VPERPASQSVQVDSVDAGQRLATVRDDKLVFRIAALGAQIRALEAQLATAQTELARGETLVERGVATVQRLDQLRTTLDVTRNQLAAAEAGRAVMVQQAAEGDVVAPTAGRVLTVPVTRGAVVLAGEPVATVGGGGFFLRLAIPERHAKSLKEGAAIRITTSGTESEGRLARVYPRIENGRVVADVLVEDLETAFGDARVLVKVPVGERHRDLAALQRAPCRAARRDPHADRLHDTAPGDGAGRWGRAMGAYRRPGLTAGAASGCGRPKSTGWHGRAAPRPKAG
jgi:multidrug resistance efflux pump